MIRTCKIILLFVIPGLVFSCKKDPETVLDFGYEYFPTDSGKFVIYDVDSVVYNDFTGTIDTFNYQLKEIITDFFYDLENRPSYKVERYKRLNDILPWEVKDIWVACLTALTAEKVEENVTFVKLYFPAKEGAFWNGNAKNTLEPATYEYASVGVYNNFGSLAFDKTLKVIQMNNKNLVEDKYAEEVYARGVGLVYKRVKDLKTEITGEIISGVDYSYTINSYGN